MSGGNAGRGPADPVDFRGPLLLIRKRLSSSSQTRLTTFPFSQTRASLWHAEQDGSFSSHFFFLSFGVSALHRIWEYGDFYSPPPARQASLTSASFAGDFVAEA